MNKTLFVNKKILGYSKRFFSVLNVEFFKNENTSPVINDNAIVKKSVDFWLKELNDDFNKVTNFF